jgi:hypothetical protein
MDRAQSHGRIMRLLALGAALIALTTGYVVMVRSSTSRNYRRSGILAPPVRSYRRERFISNR